MDKALPMAFLLFILLSGCASQPPATTASQPQNIIILLPHSGEKVNLSISGDFTQAQRYHTTTAGVGGAQREISYSAFSGVRVGMHQAIGYSDSTLAYNFTRDMYSSVGDKYICIIGDCSPFLEKKPTAISWEMNNFNKDFDYSVLVCFQNGSYAKRAYKDGQANVTQGEGCPK